MTDRPKAEWIAIALDIDHVRHRVLGYRFGIWAATPQLQAKGRTVTRTGAWSVTHLPSGFRLPLDAMSLDGALEVTRALVAAVPEYRASATFRGVASATAPQDEAAALVAALQPFAPGVRVQDGKPGMHRSAPIARRLAA